MIVDVIIPVLNEEHSIALVINEIPKSLIRDIIVVDNGSKDQTSVVARQSGATVLLEEKKGYGAACLKGIKYIQNKSVAPDIVVFLDGDYSDTPSEIVHVLHPILHESFDLVIGSRVLGISEPGSMTAVQKFGNWLSTFLIATLYQYHFTDLGPFRAITWKKLLELNMKDQNFGWTVEMQVKAAKLKFKTKEVSVSYKKRIGKSKVSGTIKGSISAGYKILTTIFRLYFTVN